MKCAVHSDVDATGFCRNCGKPMCSACARPVRDVLYCEDCLATIMGHPAPAPSAPPVTLQPPAGTPASPYAGPYVPPVPPPRPPGSNNPTIAFILAFVFPGLGAIYNRQYNKGLIYIAIFATMILGLTTGLGEGIQPVIGILLAGFVFYTAFEAMQTAQAINRGEVPSDPLGAWSKERPIGPIILIGLGLLFLLENLDVPIHLARFWPLVLIGIGVYMFRNRIAG